MTLFFNRIATHTALLQRSRYTFFKAHNFLSTNSQSPFPTLPLLDCLTEQLKPHLDLSRTAFFGVQHMLRNTGSFFDALKKLGAKPENFFFVGKCYSDHQETIEQLNLSGMTVHPGQLPHAPGHYSQRMRRQMLDLGECAAQKIAKDPRIDTVILVDEGGYAAATFPIHRLFVLAGYKRFSVACVEQTASGLFHAMDQPVFPIVNVAECATKKLLERRLIAQSVLNNVIKQFKQMPLTDRDAFGVIGNGDIGKGLVDYLLKRGFIVYVYDKNPRAFESQESRNNCIRLSNAEAVIERSRFIFGCTGHDVTKNISSKIILNEFLDDKSFFSCSSQDIEFRTWIRELSEIYNPDFKELCDLQFSLSGGKRFTFHRSGTPFNFENGPISVNDEDIQITRSLMLLGVAQAYHQKRTFIADGKTLNSSSVYQLNAAWQREVSKWWLHHYHNNRYPQDLMAQFSNLDWIDAHSKGVTPKKLPEIRLPVISPLQLEISHLNTTPPEETTGTKRQLRI